MRLIAYFDGSCGPRHGCVAAYGVVIKDEREEVIYKTFGEACRGPSATNHTAEYEGLYQAMLYVATHYAVAEVEFRGDSALVIAQMRGEAQARKGKYIPYYEKSKALAAPFVERKLWTFRWVQRALNSEADTLAQYYQWWF